MHRRNGILNILLFFKQYRNRPDMYWGFWGNCYDDYHNSVLHHGYDILKEWNENIFQKKDHVKEELGKYITNIWKEKIDKNIRHYNKLYYYYKEDYQSFSSPLFLLTSNVDHHFFNYGFDSKLIYEIHGNCDYIQCANEKCSNMKPWLITPPDFRFNVPKDKLLYNVNYSEDNKLLFCQKCDCLGRPNVMMFDDTTYYHNTIAYKTYKLWELGVEELVKNNDNISVIILEIGCGNRVPTLRMESNDIIESILSKNDGYEPQYTEDGRPKIKTIRVNLDECYCDDGCVEANYLCIKDTALHFMERVDSVMKNGLN